METDRTLIVVPTYNERDNIAALVPELFKVAPAADVLVVDDASPDRTADHAEELFGPNARFSVFRRTGSRGYGRSLLDGYRVAVERDYTRIVQLDADFSHDPAMVPILIETSRSAGVVIGSHDYRSDRAR